MTNLQLKSQNHKSFLCPNDNIKRRGLMFVISAPSGAGKTTLSKILLETDKHIHMSVSYTTRPMRSEEIDGLDYHFISIDKFKQMIDNDEFIEYAKVFDNLYGTPKKEVERNILFGEDVLFDIDWQGHRNLISRARQDVVSVFILPPSKEDLIHRITKRGKDSIDVIRNRIESANWEICHWHEYDYIIINRDIEESLTKIQSILRAERLRKERRIGLPDFVGNLIQQDIDLL
ncbi:guanylate kinase [Lyticum sinuosum]|uniref:Guanylate kinase n=1 Tax=Lyticum sinuosum TaxID=1332059 RepID=A0AAE4VKX4_9RICK|nr:guanylate kinase [Lyticum sinuosum]MDZ5761204.1 Guanylate kinase [Lyticum sinuosum]